MAAIIAVLATLCGPAIELGKCFAEPIKRQFNYLCYYNSNIQNLREEARELKDARDGLDRRVDTAENNAEVILPEVETWLKEVDEIQEKTIGILSEITNIQSGFLTIKSRFSLSKKAKKAAEALKELRTRCNFHPISYSPPPAPIPLGTTYEFESRKQTEEEIMITLQDNEVNTIGICGMGGVGKTTMAKRVMHRAREEHLFDETVMVVVSQQVDMLKIQTEIAEKLALNLGEQSLLSRAQRLHTRLVGRKRILIILDDVWEKLKLDDLGIPHISGLKGLKVLLTSRNSNILKAMNVQRVYALEVLSGTEARFLFKSNVGTCIDDHDVSPVAQQVVQECNGLPIALVTVGLALKDQKNISMWRDALQQLKTSNPIDMPEVLEDVYRPLRLSYEFLKNERAKSLFLLCCLFPEDHPISVSHLTFYAKGLGILEGIWNLEQARNRTCSLVEMLKSRFLLLDIDFVLLRDEFVRMHDVFRDLAIFIASEERHIIKCRDCTWISSYHLEGRAELLMGQNPNLRLLLIENSANKELIINDSLFEGTRELNVLSISNDPLRSLPHTTHLLKNLRTLILYSCASLETISVAGELVSLEILICHRCKSLVELPVEIKKLNQLKLLGLKACGKLQKIAPGVIPSLVGLEELGMYASFNQWEAEDEGKDRKYASLNELQSLPV